CYSVNVFRYEPEHAGRDREIFQIGLELIGPKGTAADVEPIMVAAECLRRLGVTAFTIALGQGAFFNALLRRTGVAESIQRSLRDMGEIRRMEYYTGLVFDIYVDAVGAEIGGGGRYDHLIGRFGHEVPSTGFAFDLDRLLQLRAAPGGREHASGVRSRDAAVR